MLIADVRAHLLKARERAGVRLSEIETSADAAGEGLGDDVIVRVGGPKLERLKQVERAASEMAAAAAIPTAAQAMLIRLPLVGKHVKAQHLKAQQSADEAVRVALRLRQGFEERIRAILRTKARAAAVEDHRFEIDRLREVSSWCARMLGRLDRLASAKVTTIDLDRPARGDAPKWFANLEMQLQGAELRVFGNGATVINDGMDHAGLDLSPRSAVAPMLVLGPSFEARPWLNGAVDERWCLLPEHRLPGSLSGFRLRGPSLVASPKGLFAPRERRGVPLLPGGYNSKERIYLPVPLTRVDEVVAAGGAMGHKGGLFVDPTRVDAGGAVSRFLPFVAQRWYVPLPAEKIPKTSWGASLASLLAPASWNEIRRRVTDAFGGLCQICGQLKGGSAIECHEIWDYESERVVDGMRVQKLIGMLSVCKACHGVFHQGFSHMRGHGDAAAYRLADINGWSMAEMELAEAWMQGNYVERSRYHWALDLSLVDNGKPLVLNKGKCTVTPSGTLRAIGANGLDQATRLIGVSFRVGSTGSVLRQNC